MSSDTAKENENASVVDSSVTEWKQEMGNSDDPESSSYRADEDGYPSKQEGGGHSGGLLESSNANKQGQTYKTRYFIIKSLNYENIQLSMQKEIWATQVMNEPILEEAFHNTSRVILIFSVNMSGFFQGYAEMMSPVGWRRENIWSQGGANGNPWGRSFKIKWLRLNELPFQKTLHLKNPLNGYKPVKISRDCQELPEDIGKALCELLDEISFEDSSLNRFSRDDLALKRHCLDLPCSSGDEEYNLPSMLTSWPGMHPSYSPNLLYQHPADAPRFHSSHHRSSGGAEYKHISGASKVTSMIHSQSILQADTDRSYRFDVSGLSAESSLASTVTDEDILEMSYEEYLEAHSRSIQQSGVPDNNVDIRETRKMSLEQAVLKSRSKHESSSRRRDEDLNSSFAREGSHLRKKSRCSSSR